MDPIQLIRKDHATVKALFRRFEKADRTSERQKLGQEIIEELSVHAVIEEQLIYPLLREREVRLEDRVLNALEEHHAVKLVLAELDTLDADHERYRAKVHVVRESVEMHIEGEEAKLLPRLEAALDADESKSLAEAMLRLKEIAPNYPHPSAPDTPPGLSIAGLIAKLTDSGKDVLRQLTSPDKAAGHRSVQRRVSSATAKTRRRPARTAARRGKKRSATTKARRRSTGAASRSGKKRRRAT
jgi:hemerythrin superfamily protein